MPNLPIRDVSLFVDVVGHGYPLLLMHGGPGADHLTLLPFRRLADRFTLIFYDHRCNGRSEGADLSSMTWANLTADADALREQLGIDKWAVLGHSFGGNVALEYALGIRASCRTSSSWIRAPTAAGHRRTRRGCLPGAGMTRRPSCWPDASSMGGSRRGSSSRRCYGSEAPTTPTSAFEGWRAR